VLTRVTDFVSLEEMIDTIQINKFSSLHDGKNIIFCKTDFLLSEFEEIKKIQNDVVLISGNSDYEINHVQISRLPSNVKKWYAQNAMITNDVIECLPLGIENLHNSYRGDFHGIGYSRVQIKENLILNQEIKSPHKLIYGNFNISTNYSHRTQVREICRTSDFIDWDEPNLSLETFFTKILDYEAVVCAQGNGPGDNHRIYEVLYMNRIPITFNKIMYDNLHKNFPVILLEDINLLKNYDYMTSRINEVKNRNWDKEMLYSKYWINKIKSSI
jgi:hypothetical protein